MSLPFHKVIIATKWFYFARFIIGNLDFNGNSFFFFESADIQGGRIVLKVAPIHHWFESNAVRKSPTEIIAIGHFKGLFFSFNF